MPADSYQQLEFRPRQRSSNKHQEDHLLRIRTKLKSISKMEIHEAKHSPHQNLRDFLHSMHACALSSSCPTLYDPVNCSLPRSSVHGILQERILEGVAVPSSKGSSWPRDQVLISLPSPALAGRFFTSSASWEAPLTLYTLSRNAGGIKNKKK